MTWLDEKWELHIIPMRILHAEHKKDNQFIIMTLRVVERGRTLHSLDNRATRIVSLEFISTKATLLNPIEPLMYIPASQLFIVSEDSRRDKIFAYSVSITHALHALASSLQPTVTNWAEMSCTSHTLWTVHKGACGYSHVQSDDSWHAHIASDPTSCTQIDQDDPAAHGKRHDLSVKSNTGGLENATKLVQIYCRAEATDFLILKAGDTWRWPCK